MRVRDERPSDATTIDRIIAAAFENHPQSDGREPLIVRRLRDGGALSISFVAEEGGVISGYIAFSPIILADARDWYALGPLAVTPSCQNAGFGSALVGSGLDRLRALGAEGCVVVGEAGYYARFGFVRVPGLICDGIPERFVLALTFAGRARKGRVTHHPAFDAGN